MRPEARGADHIMRTHSSRRNFLRRSLAAAASAPLLRSLEERALAEELGSPEPRSAGSGARLPSASNEPKLPAGRVGNVSISRVICGGNLISGFAHSRDLIYVSPLLKHYFTDEKVMQTWGICEAHGINTMILNPSDERALAVYGRYRQGGGKIQYLAQVGPALDDLAGPVRQAKEAGAVGAFLLGNYGDAWTREGHTASIGKLLGIIRDHGLIAGVAAHELRTVQAVEKAGFKPDFYLKTLHDTNYWSARRPEQTREVIDNYSVDNYWCMDPKETIAFMAGLDTPWIAYKILAAGAIRPRHGFEHAFNNGADFVAVGMFDFQIAEDASVARAAIRDARNRDREWCA